MKNIKAHHFLSDEKFEKQFEECTLNPSLFNHEAHLRLAWIHVTRYGLNKAAFNLCEQIQRFDAMFGDGTKFNKTLTMASAKAIHHFINRSKSKNFADFILEFPRLKFNFKDILGTHYKIDLVNNEVAKHTYLEPDLLPFT